MNSSKFKPNESSPLLQLFKCEKFLSLLQCMWEHTCYFPQFTLDKIHGPSCQAPSTHGELSDWYAVMQGDEWSSSFGALCYELLSRIISQLKVTTIRALKMAYKKGSEWNICRQKMKYWKYQLHFHLLAMKSKQTVPHPSVWSPKMSRNQSRKLPGLIFKSIRSQHTSTKSGNYRTFTGSWIVQKPVKKKINLLEMKSPTRYYYHDK